MRFKLLYIYIYIYVFVINLYMLMNAREKENKVAPDFQIQSLFFGIKVKAIIVKKKKKIKRTK